VKASYDVVVIGGGIVGCACAYYLSQTFGDMLLLEPGAVGGGATAAGMGHLVVMDDSEAQFALTRYSLELWQELQPELPAAVEYEQRGTLWVAEDEEEWRLLSGKQSFYADRGVEAEVVDGPALSGLEPSLRRGLPGALLTPQDAVIFPMTAAQFLLSRAMSNGCELERTAARQLSGKKITLVDGRVVEGAMVINAAGDHAPMLTEGLNIKPRKGHLVITDRYPSHVRHQLVEVGYLKSAHTMGSESVAFNVQPRATGQLLVGSSRQFVGDDPAFDHALVAKMLARATSFMPSLANLNAVRAWTGFRAATPDKLPLIGPWPFSPGLFVAAGHEGLGVTTSLATGRMLADMVTGLRPAIDPSPYAAARAMNG
jgi:D-hydroxyproline dehydrogenase subunit beta